jgi:hypothetical protein
LSQEGVKGFSNGGQQGKYARFRRRCGITIEGFYKGTGIKERISVISLFSAFFSKGTIIGFVHRRGDLRCCSTLIMGTPWLFRGYFSMFYILTGGNP